MSGIVYLVRHGRTGGNGNRYVGWEDVPLDATGCEQACIAGEALAALPLDAVHTSPLQRARATAAGLRADRPELPFAVDARLREVHYGHLTGRDKREHPLRLRRDHLQQPLPGGESLDDVGIRVRAYLADALEPALRRGEAVAVVAHFWSLRQLLAALRGQDLQALLRANDYKPENGSVYALPVTPTAAGLRAGALARVDVAQPALAS
jgi:broad specificity phosphatase PhoE